MIEVRFRYGPRDGDVVDLPEARGIISLTSRPDGIYTRTTEPGSNPALYEWIDLLDSRDMDE